MNEPSVSIVGDRCCGCGACAAACPVSCIVMNADACGFVRPNYEGGCVGCGRCEKACPVLSVGDCDDEVSVCWAKAKDDNLRDRSSSGAAFGLLAKRVLGRGGAVYGAAFTDGCKAVQHVRVTDEDDLELIMRSKYVQSSVGIDAYKGVECDLRNGLQVLFSGTACQNAAIRNYLDLNKVPTQGLLLVDVICHGVPSPRLWAEWLDYVSCSAGVEVDEVNFRSKSTGWLTYSVAYYVATEKVRSATNNHDWYMKAFLRNASIRRSCLSCPAKRRCGSDITLGDFWGIQNVHPEALDALGVSAVICNTKKGAVALHDLGDSVMFGPSTFDEVVEGNCALQHSVAPHPKREQFLNELAGGKSIEYLMDTWEFKTPLKQRVKGKLSHIKHRILKSAQET